MHSNHSESHPWGCFLLHTTVTQDIYLYFSPSRPNDIYRERHFCRRMHHSGVGIFSVTEKTKTARKSDREGVSSCVLYTEGGMHACMWGIVSCIVFVGTAAEFMGGEPGSPLRRSVCACAKLGSGILETTFVATRNLIVCEGRLLRQIACLYKWLSYIVISSCGREDTKIVVCPSSLRHTTSNESSSNSMLKSSMRC